MRVASCRVGIRTAIVNFEAPLAAYSEGLGMPLPRNGEFWNVRLSARGQSENYLTLAWAGESFWRCAGAGSRFGIANITMPTASRRAPWNGKSVFETTQRSQVRSPSANEDAFMLKSMSALSLRATVANSSRYCFSCERKNPSKAQNARTGM
jgi:hypothetical protein